MDGMTVFDATSDSVSGRPVETDTTGRVTGQRTAVQPRLGDEMTPDDVRFSQNLMSRQLKTDFRDLGFSDMHAVSWYRVGISAGRANRYRSNGWTFFDVREVRDTITRAGFTPSTILRKVTDQFGGTSVPLLVAAYYWRAQIPVDEAVAHWEPRRLAGEDVVPALEMLLALTGTLPPR